MHQPHFSRRSSSGFSLTELLVVMCIVVTLTTVSGPVLSAIKGSGATNRASADLARTIELSRVYAMANNTYVRVAMGQVAPNGSTRLTPALVVVALGSADGTLAASSASDMVNVSKWIPLGKPLILDNFCMFDQSLNAQNPSTTADVVPSSSDMVIFSKAVAGLGTVSFSSFVQFSPGGEACVIQGQTARYIKIACDQPIQPSNLSTAQNKNPFILRLSGVNGRIDVLRKENM